MAKTTIVAVTTALLLGGAAYAQETPATTAPAPGSPTAVPEDTSGAPIVTDKPAGSSDDATMPAAPQVDSSMESGTRTTSDPASSEAVPGAKESTATATPTPDATGSTATGTPAAGTVAPTTATAAAGGWRSFKSLGEEFKGEIAGGFKADDLIGADVVDKDGKSVGEVSDLVIGADQKVDHVIVDVGGFLGMGEKPVAIQLDQLKRSGDSSDLMVGLSKDQIESMPQVKQGQDGTLNTSS